YPMRVPDHRQAFHPEDQTMRDALRQWPRGPLARVRPDWLPANRSLPAIYRLRTETGGEPVPQGERAGDLPLAMVEAALLAADEPLTTRRLANAAGLTDASEARRLLRKLQALYDREGSAFQVEELAGGFQL